jgi:hypothetical protein
MTSNKHILAAALIAALTITATLAGCASPQKQPLLPAQTPPPGLQADLARVAAITPAGTCPAWATTRWGVWYVVRRGGEYVVTVTVHGQAADVLARVDGHLAVAVDQGRGKGSNTVRLARGWHEISVKAHGARGTTPQHDAVSWSIHRLGSPSPLLPYWPQ